MPHQDLRRWLLSRPNPPSVAALYRKPRVLVFLLGVSRSVLCGERLKLISRANAFGTGGSRGSAFLGPILDPTLEGVKQLLQFCVIRVDPKLYLLKVMPKFLAAGADDRGREPIWASADVSSRPAEQDSQQISQETRACLPNKPQIHHTSRHWST
jgi:hypothetical protein